MSSILRRAGFKLAFWIERAGDPGATGSQIKMYTKDVAATSQLFAQDSGGTVHQITPAAALVGQEMPPEIWGQIDVAASQAAVDLAANASQLFDTAAAIRAGSITGMTTRFTEAITDATVSSALVTVTVNGAAGTLNLAHSSGVNPSGGETTQATGVDTYSGGDTLGFEITTLSTFAPVTTDLDVTMEITRS